MKKFLLLAFISLIASSSFGSGFDSFKNKKIQEPEICKPLRDNKKKTQEKNSDENPCQLKSTDAVTTAAPATEKTKQDKLQLP